MSGISCPPGRHVADAPNGLLSSPEDGLPRAKSIQWHLEQTNVGGAWRHTRGEGIAIAIVDDAVDTRHREFGGRVVGAVDITSGERLSLPKGWQPHGTECAGIACAAGHEVAGVAPAANLMGVRLGQLPLHMGDERVADALRWAAENGADVISCSWGPERGVHAELPVRTRRAIDWAAEHGRSGNGCVITFAAGNEDVAVELNDYASHPRVIAVGACNRHDKRCRHSNWGDALWCVFPSSDPCDPKGAYAEICTTTPIGSFLLGETYYTDSFGYTSAACAGLAGLCALILSANPDLTQCEVKQVLRDSCVKIDAEGGTYDENGRSPYYGYGRPDAAVAVGLALERRTSGPS